MAADGIEGLSRFCGHSPKDLMLWSVNALQPDKRGKGAGRGSLEVLDLRGHTTLCGMRPLSVVDRRRFEEE